MPEQTQDPTRVAIACQGGGSHTAFTAGCLQAVLEQYRLDLDSEAGPSLAGRPCQLVGFSGTSGGAMSALLAWYGLLEGGPGDAARRLQGFWRDEAATELSDYLINQASVLALRTDLLPELSPYDFEPVLAAANLWDSALDSVPEPLRRLWPWIPRWQWGGERRTRDESSDHALRLLYDGAERLRALLQTWVTFEQIEPLKQRWQAD